MLLGIAVTTGYAPYQGWPSVVPACTPAWRADRLAPTEALAAP